MQQSLGRLPLLIPENREEIDGSHPPRSSSPPIQPQQAHHKDYLDHTHNDTGHTHNDTGHTYNDTGDAHSDAMRQKRWRNWKKSVSRRSQSLRDFFRPRSLYTPHPHHLHRRHYHHLSSHSHHQHPPRHSFQDLAPNSRLRAGSDGGLSFTHTHTSTPTHSHSLSHSLTHTLTHSLTHTLTHTLTHSLTHSPTLSLIHTLTNHRCSDPSLKASWYHHPHLLLATNHSTTEVTLPTHSQWHLNHPP